VTAPIRQLDRASISAEVLEITRGLLKELGSGHAIGALRGPAQLDRDLGLGSLERVELLLRIERVVGVSLPEQSMAAAETLDDVIAAVEQSATTKSRRAAAPADESSAAAAAGSADTLVSASEAASPAAAADSWQEVLRYRARVDAARTHLILWEEEGVARRVSFGELYSGALRVAAALGQRGIARGDSVALMLPTSLDFFLTFAGVLLAGGVPVPIYPPVRADRIAEYAERQSAILRNAKARLLVTFREAAMAAKLLKPRVPSLRGIVTAAELQGSNATQVGGSAPSDSSRSAASPGGSSLQDAAQEAAGALATDVRTGASDLALLQYTSGSTGDPKGVMLTHGNLLANVRAIGEALAVRPDDVGVSWLPLYHDMGLIGAWLMPLYFGLPLVVMSPLAFLTRPERWLHALSEHRGTLTAAPNFAYELAIRRVAEGDLARLDLRPVRAMLNGAEPVNAGTLERFAARFAPCGLRREALMPVYGLAEAALAVTVPPLERGLRVDRVLRAAFEGEGRAVPCGAAGEEQAEVLSFVSVGKPVPAHEVRIVDGAGQELGERAEGMLWFRGPSTTGGYFDNEDATRNLFPQGKAEGWLTSGDRAYRAEGEIFITGRTKEIILKAGRNIYPYEVEEVAARVAGVRKGCVAVFGVADAAAGTERLVVAAETRERGEAGRRRIVAEINEHVSATIGMPPDSVELVPPHGIPKTSSGKLRRDQVRRLYLAGTLGKGAQPAWVQVLRLGAANGARDAGRWLRRGLEFLYGVYAAAVFVPWLVVSWALLRLARGRGGAARFTPAALRVYFALIGCRVEVRGRENLPAGEPVVYVSNHTSYFDVLVLMAALGAEYRFVAKSEVHAMPMIGTFLRRMEHFAFKREDPQARLRQARQLEEALEKGVSVFVFPEGTFTAREGVRPFHLGAFRAAADTGCPVVPVALRGTRQFLRDKTMLPRPSHIVVTVCPALGVRAGSKNAWQEVVRLRNLAREEISRYAGEPLL
jgi:1-acyl-sn-glycerol-3-phosphate acyltransferase